MRPLLIPMNYKSVLFWTFVAIVIAVTIGLMYDPGPPNG
jgi:hypothetical protein